MANATARLSGAEIPVSGTDEAPSLGARTKALLARLGRAFLAAQQRRVDREIALLLQRNGGVLSDDVERRFLDPQRGR